MRQVTIHHAKTQLSRLIEAAVAGEDVVIAKGNMPVVRLVPIVKGGFKVGMLGGVLGSGPNFFERASEADCAEWEG